MQVKRSIEVSRRAECFASKRIIMGASTTTNRTEAAPLAAMRLDTFLAISAGVEIPTVDPIHHHDHSRSVVAVALSRRTLPQMEQGN
jgi:hypothetical protein